MERYGDSTARAPHSTRARAACLLLFVCFLSGPAFTQNEIELGEMSLEELMNVEVTSVSKRSEKRSEVAAAIFVVSNEDIRRSGVTTIADALRLVPGLNVAKLDANKWAITSRGFNDRFANKLLVLLDGRTIYTPLFAGVFWEIQDTVLQDIDRIEVIRGPGGTLWGANAVNGVINIITKKSADTQGGYLKIGGGTEEKTFGTFRYGGAAGPKGHYRFYTKFFNRDEGELPSGKSGSDSWDVGRAGFRLDWTLSEQDSLTFQGDVFDGDFSQEGITPVPGPPFSVNNDNISDHWGGNLLLRWDHKLSERSETQFQFYYDHTELRTSIVDEDRDTFDLDFNHHVRLGENNEFIWGAGYRLTADDLSETFVESFDPDHRTDRLYSVFVQDEIRFLDSRLRLTMGSKFEYNEYSGFEVMPSARLAWIPNEDHTLWGSVSRAMRTPTRLQDVRLISQSLPGVLIGLGGGGDFKAEELIAYEIGYRYSGSDFVLLDLTVFFNDYDDLRTLEFQAPFLEIFPLPPHLFIPVVAFNNMTAEIYGIEIVADWKLKPWWQVRTTYSFLEIDLDLSPATFDILSGALDGDTPEQQFSVFSRMDLPRHVQLDFFLHYVDRLPSLDVDSYWGLDVRLAWKPKDGLELSLVGQNLIESRHLEFDSTFVPTVATPLERGVYGAITWTF